ncbi:MAG: hypothetical protein IJ589_05015 [Lachnospiraceae bacterium]|nr:hypothetical protein [Lachnospiraceae bacterium]
MQRPDLKAMRLWIGEGENHFTMSRGSFRYKQKIRNKRELRREGIEESPRGHRIRFSDPKTGQEHVLAVTGREDGLQEVRYEAPFLGSGQMRMGKRIRPDRLPGSGSVFRFHQRSISTAAVRPIPNLT